jgi:glycosyltransferase involved in cell wall biosynthesis
MDEALGFVGDRTDPPRRGDICLTLDADCYPLGTLPPITAIAAGRIYGCRRYDGRPGFTRGPEIVMRGRIAQSQHRLCPSVGGGYFQLFRWDGVERFGSYPGADGYDYDFAMRFQEGALVNSIDVLHYGDTHQNWWGRVTPRWSPSM